MTDQTQSDEHADDLFFGGVPTEPDVERIRAAYPESSLTKGTAITYGDIAHVIGYPKQSSRFRTVTDRWRKRLAHDHGIEVKAIAGTGFKVMTDLERVNHSESNMKSAVRKARVSYRVAAHTDVRNLGQDDRARLTHQQQIGRAHV